MGPLDVARGVFDVRGNRPLLSRSTPSPDQGTPGETLGSQNRGASLHRSSDETVGRGLREKRVVGRKATRALIVGPAVPARLSGWEATMGTVAATILTMTLSLTPSNGGALSPAQITINKQPGEQFDPHVDQDLAAYSNIVPVQDRSARRRPTCASGRPSLYQWETGTCPCAIAISCRCAPRWRASRRTNRRVYPRSRRSQWRRPGALRGTGTGSPSPSSVHRCALRALRAARMRSRWCQSCRWPRGPRFAR